MAKRHAGRELWARMQRFAEVEDGLPVYECGPWTLEKLFFLCQYLATTTKVIVGNSKFSSVDYLDLFASNGVCSVTGDDGRARRYAGSALLAAGCEKPFNNLFLVEKDPSNAEALARRLNRLNTRSKVDIQVGDANAASVNLASRLPHGSLTVAFVDPFSLGIHFETLRLLASRRAMDFIILFADSMDISRNVEEYYASQRSDKLDLFLGKDSNWRGSWAKLADHTGSSCRKFFADTYIAQFSQLGYAYHRVKAIASDRGQLYSLVYLSKNDLGLKFWDIAANERLDGTKGLFGA